MIYLLEDVNLTVDYLLSITKHLDDNVPVYNSCFYAKYTEELLEMGKIEQFEPILFIDIDGDVLTAVYNFENNGVPITLKDIRNIPEYKRHNMIERDVDDGYVFEYYENLAYYEGAIVLC